jgi:hypothetical protein
MDSKEGNRDAPDRDAALERAIEEIRKMQAERKQ